MSANDLVKITQEHYLVVMSSIRNSLNGEKLSSINLVHAITSGMISAGAFSLLSGKEKKQLVLQSLHMLVDEFKFDQSMIDIVNNLIDIVGPTVIDGLYNSSLGSFNFGVLKNNKCCIIC
jgi:hypothetical protein